MDGASFSMCECSGIVKSGTTDHPTELVQVGDKVAWIDVGLVDVITALWRAGIGTKECCQSCRDGRGYIVFDDGRNTMIRFPGIPTL